MITHRWTVTAIDYAPDYKCEVCLKPHSNEFSLTCETCDAKRESEDLTIKTEIEEADSDLKERRAAALRHWERCFLDGTVDDQHAEFIAGILAKAREEIE